MDKSTYFQALGLEPTATAAEVEANYLRLVQFLESNSIPPALRTWASKEAALVDEAYAALTESVDEDEVEEPARARGRLPAQRAATKAAPVVRQSSPANLVDDDDVADDDEEYEELADQFDEPVARRQSGQSNRQQPAVQQVSRQSVGSPRHGPAARPAQAGWREPGRNRGRATGGSQVYARGRRQEQADRTKRIMYGSIAGLVVVIVLGFWAIQSGPLADQTTGSANFDQARYQMLKAAVAKNPNDVAALFELGQITFEADRFEESLTWLQRELELQPNDVQALQDVGTAYFNLGDREKAMSWWQKALAVEPNNQQTHWNLSFYYASADPQELDAAVAEWKKVVEINPNTQLAKTAQAHLDQYNKQPAR